MRLSMNEVKCGKPMLTVNEPNEIKTNECPEASTEETPPPRHETLVLEELCVEDLRSNLVRAKLVESRAKDHRIEIENEIVRRFGSYVPENGSKTFLLADGEKLVVKCGITYKADIDELRNSGLPEDVLPLKLVPSQYVFDAKAYEDILKTATPSIRNKLAEYVVTSPRKPAVSL